MRIKNLLFLFIAVAVFFVMFLPKQSTGDSGDNPNTGSITDFDHSHTIYAELLEKYVENGKVDYKGFIASGEKFQRYLDQLASVSEEDFKEWSREEKLAFWINSYNAFTIEAIIDNYPIERNFGLSALIYPKNSIRQIEGVWDELKFSAAGRYVTLGEIEHEILRKEFNEPRIHAAIVCASIGCPDLMDEPYVPDRIDRQLTRASESFVNNPEKGVNIDMSGRNVSLSKIFNWFGEDFVPVYGTSEYFKGKNENERAVLNFVRKHLNSEEDRQFLISSDFSLSYMDYDWSLNELKK